jgi:hypothetical protein
MGRGGAPWRLSPLPGGHGSQTSIPPTASHDREGVVSGPRLCLTNAPAVKLQNALLMP